jgi:hypothetical protein
MPFTLKKYGWLLVALLLGVALVMWHIWLSSRANTIAQPSDGWSAASSSIGAISEVSTSTGSPTAQKTLPPEPVFILPEDAEMIDEYAYVYNTDVYFKPLIDANKPLSVPSGDPETFERLRDMMTYPGSAIVRDCGAAPTYTFYVDKHRPYFYQIWRAPKFRASHIDAMNGADASNFAITGSTSANDGRIFFEITYQKVATSTCRLILEQSTF